MTMFLIQAALLLLIAFILGCILGCLFHRWFAEAPVEAAVAVAAAPVMAKAVAPKPKAPAAPKPKAPPKPAVSTERDNLKRIKGIGVQNESRLNSDGTYRFAQIARWTAKDQREIGERLAFPGRIEREDWVKQAKVLAAGGQTTFSKRVSRGQVATSPRKPGGRRK